MVKNFYIPPNTHVGIQQVAQQRKHQALPTNRFLEYSEETKRKRQQANLLSGYSDYLCAGRNFAMLELQKLCRNFVFVVAYPARP